MPWRATGRVDLAQEVEKVAAFDRAEPQRVHERGEDDIGCPAHISALQLGVVVETHGRQNGDLLPTQPGHPTEAAEVGQADVAWGEAGAAGDEELLDVLLGLRAAHTEEASPGRGCQEPTSLGLL